MWGNIHVNDTAALGDFDIHLITTDTKVANCFALIFMIPYIKKELFAQGRYLLGRVIQLQHLHHRTFCVLFYPFLLSQHFWANSTKLWGCLKRSKKGCCLPNFWKSQVFYIHFATSFLTCDVPTSRRDYPRNPASLATCGSPCIHLKSLLNMKDLQSYILLCWPMQ